MGAVRQAGGRIQVVSSDTQSQDENNSRLVVRPGEDAHLAAEGGQGARSEREPLQESEDAPKGALDEVVQSLAWLCPETDHHKAEVLPR